LIKKIGLMFVLLLMADVALAKPLFNPVRLGKRCYWQPIARIICNLGSAERVFEGCAAALSSPELSAEDKNAIRTSSLCLKDMSIKAEPKTE
jgi:hypothetical protein